MTDEQMRAECAAIEAEWQMGGLTGGLYEDFAMELAKRAQAAERERWRDELAYAEAALADIGDADREPGDDMAWCESRAAQALPRVRAALKA